MSSSRRRPEQQLSISQGRDAREIQLPPSAGKCFLLTSPFIERVRQIILRSPGCRLTSLGPCHSEHAVATARTLPLSEAKGLCRGLRSPSTLYRYSAAELVYWDISFPSSKKSLSLSCMKAA